jgi:hypothetical protein
MAKGLHDDILSIGNLNGGIVNRFGYCMHIGHEDDDGVEELVKGPEGVPPTSFEMFELWKEHLYSKTTEMWLSKIGKFDYDWRLIKFVEDFIRLAEGKFQNFKDKLYIKGGVLHNLIFKGQNFHLESDGEVYTPSMSDFDFGLKVDEVYDDALSADQKRIKVHQMARKIRTVLVLYREALLESGLFDIDRKTLDGHLKGVMEEYNRKRDPKLPEIKRLRCFNGTHPRSVWGIVPEVQRSDMSITPFPKEGKLGEQAGAARVCLTRRGHPLFISDNHNLFFIKGEGSEVHFDLVRLKLAFEAECKGDVPGYTATRGFDDAFNEQMNGDTWLKRAYGEVIDVSIDHASRGAAVTYLDGQLNASEQYTFSHDGDREERVQFHGQSILVVVDDLARIIFQESNYKPENAAKSTKRSFRLCFAIAALASYEIVLGQKKTRITELLTALEKEIDNWTYADVRGEDLDLGRLFGVNTVWRSLYNDFLKVNSQSALYKIRFSEAFRKCIDSALVEPLKDPHTIIVPWNPNLVELTLPEDI